MADRGEHRIQDDSVEGVTNPNDTSATSVSIREVNSNTTTPKPPPTYVGETFTNQEWQASCIRFDKAISEYERAANEWEFQMDHSEGHYFFRFAENDPDKFYFENAENPEALAAARNYEFALPPHPTTFLAARSAYRDAQSEYRKARDEAQAQLDAKKAELKRLGNKRKRS